MTFTKLEFKNITQKQTTLHDHNVMCYGILPEKRSRILSDKPFFQKKELTETQKNWLLLHDESNWNEIEVFQKYKTSKGMIKELKWKLPGTEEKKETCGIWINEGCDNVWGHPENKVFVKHRKRSCFRSSCEYCWLEKWLARESHRATQRIENYIEVFKNLQFARSPKFQRKYLKPVHVIVSPPQWDSNMRYDLLKKKARKLIEQAGIEGGLLIFHPFVLNKDSGKWEKRPHFHIVGFGWVSNTNKISNSDGWVIKNKGIRDSLHSTIYYLLSHAGVSESVHSVTWFGSLSYRAKYSSYFKLEEEDNFNFCDYCGIMLVNFEYVGLDRPPDYEFVGLVESKDWKPLETLEEALDRKNRFKPKLEKEKANLNPYWNEKCRKAVEEADMCFKKLRCFN